MDASTPTTRDHGPQPIATLTEECGLKSADLVEASPAQLTHKTVARACKGRWLTPNSRRKVLAAMNAASGKAFQMNELFSYA
ncbi:MAG: hypothetical protein ACPG31_06765 [Planctomycetota bacterium]